jgi:Protein of unknown function (DUF732)
MPKRLIRDGEQDDTMGRSEIPNDDPETTIVATDTAAAPELAWSVDDDDEQPEHRSWEDAGSAAGLIVAVCAAVAVVVYVVHTMGGHHDAAVPSRAVITTVHPTAAAPAPAVTTTVTVTPTPVLPVDKDARFLALIEPLHLGPGYISPQSARSGCRELEEGNGTRASWIARALENAPALSIDQVTGAINTAVEVYCPEYAND